MARDIIPILILIIILFALFPGLFFMDEVLFFHDIMHHHYPWRAYNAIQYRNFSLPLWNPLGGCGFPMLADGQSGPLYLPNMLLFYVFSPFIAYNLLIIGHFFMAGIFTYMLSRRLGLSPQASLLSSAVYMISGFAVSHLTFMHMISAYPWLPLAFLLIEHGRKRALFLALAGAVIGMQFTAGHPQIATYSLMAALFYVLWRFGTRMRRLIPALIIIIIFSLAIPAAQLLPMAELSSHSAREVAGESFLGWGSFPPFQVINFIFPHFFGFDSPASIPISYQNRAPTPISSPTGGWGYWGVGVNYWEFCFYVGIVPLLLAFAAPPRRAGVFIVLAITSFLFMLGKYNPIYRLLMGVPPFSFFRFPTRFGYLLTFALAMMGGYGLDNLLEKRQIAKRLAVIAIALVIFFVAFFTVANFILFRWSSVIEAWLSAVVEPARLDRALAFIHGLKGATCLGRPEILFPISFLILASLVFGSTTRMKKTFSAALIILITLVDLCAFAWGFNPTTPVEVALQKPATAYVLPEGDVPWRITILDRHVPVAFEKDLLTASYGMLFDISDIEFPSPLMPRRLPTLIDATGTSLAAIPLSKTMRRMERNRGLLDLMNVRFILTIHEIDLPGFKRISEGRVKVYENENYIPRAFIVGKATPMDEEEALAYMTGPSFDPLNEVLVEADASSIQRAKYDVRGSKCTIDQYLPERVKIKVDTLQGGWLVLTDTYYPGWKAQIDGEEVPIWRANYAFRAVELPPGSHTIDFLYRPGSFLLGMGISIIGVLIILVWGLTPSLRRIHIPS